MGVEPRSDVGKYLISADPGKTGALAAIGHNGHVEGIMDMPLAVFANSKAYFVDGAKLNEFFETYPPHTIVVEMVASRPKQGIASAFQFGTSYGALVAYALSRCEKVFIVSPSQWKRAFGLIRSKKDAARIEALRMFPDLAQELRRKKDGGRADAVLLGEYARRTLLH